MCVEGYSHTHPRKFQNSRHVLDKLAISAPHIEDHFLTANIVCYFPPIFQRACGHAAEWATFYTENGLTAGNNRYCSYKVLTSHISPHTQPQFPRTKQTHELSHQQGRSWEKRGQCCGPTGEYCKFKKMQLFVFKNMKLLR